MFKLCFSLTLSKKNTLLYVAFCDCIQHEYVYKLGIFIRRMANTLFVLSDYSEKLNNIRIKTSSFDKNAHTNCISPFFSSKTVNIFSFNINL